MSIGLDDAEADLFGYAVTVAFDGDVVQLRIVRTPAFQIACGDTKFGVSMLICCNVVFDADLWDDDL